MFLINWVKRLKAQVLKEVRLKDKDILSETERGYGGIN